MDMSEEIEKSRTRKKKEAKALQQIGERLTTLSEAQLGRMALPSDLMEALLDAKSMRSHGARRRQMQYVGTLMRSVDVEPIEQALMDIEQGAYRQTQAFHRLEAWRDRLIDGDDALMAEILEDYPNADRQRLSQLVRSARKESGKEAPARSARHLFRYLQGIVKT